MKKRHLATKASNSLSAGLLVIAILAAAANHRQSELKPEHREPPVPQPAAEPEGSKDRPIAVPSVVLPPPPDLAVAPESGEAAAPRPEAARASEPQARPQRLVKALEAEARKATAAAAKKEVTALRPRPRAEAQEVPLPSSPPSEAAAPPREEAVSQEPVEVFERQPREDLAVVAPGEVAVTDGRRLLRLLEHGSGPLVELAWPAQRSERARLYRRLSACYGMQVALLDRDDRIFLARGEAGTPWDINRDRYSGFIRRPSGSLSDEERAAAARIRSHHSGLSQAHPVRLFPRQVDALLLGGLRQLVGEGYGGLRSIRARYRLAGRRLFLEEISADGRRLAGRVDLSRAADSACR
ncbi:MAG: hypothetical protein QNJ30_06595 [Kiloniellales bacterium]|nr:hypothetical protein [Kiloniellales bacterium]